MALLGKTKMDDQYAGPKPSGRLEPLDITFENKGDRLIGLGAINGILKILTLGLYTFWGKTEVRRRIWSFTRINGEPLSYSGTGRELFLGFVIVFFVFILPSLLGAIGVSMMFAGSKSAIAIYQGVFYFVVFLILGNAMYRAQRYRLSRTAWRGIHGALVGSPQRYGWTYFWTLAAPIAVIGLIAGLVAWQASVQSGVVLASLGSIAALWIFPWRANKLQKMLTNDTRFGDRPLNYDGTSGPLYKRYFFAWAGTALLGFGAMVASSAYALNNGIVEKIRGKIPLDGQEILTFVAIAALTLLAVAMVTAWYRASQMNHFARHTHFEGATFRLDAKGSSLMWLVLSNWLITSLGFLAGVLMGLVVARLAGPFAAASSSPAEAAVLGMRYLLPMALPVIIWTTVAQTFAQFRSVRYFMSRLKLNGAVDLGAIMQSQYQRPKRGEGLAQVFDFDAF